MKVCAVTTWPPHRDGVALYASKLYAQVAKLVTVEIVANIPQQNTTFDSRQQKAITVLRCWKRSIWYPLQIFRSVSKTRCNIVHVQHGWFLYGSFVSSLLFPVLLFLFRLSRKPCVVTMHTVIRKDANMYDNLVVNFLAHVAVLWISRCTACISDKIIVHNSLIKQILQTEQGVNGKKISIIPHGAKDAPNEPEISKNSETFCILSLGFLRKKKGIECLIEAFKNFLEKWPDTKLVIIGGSHAHDKTGCPEDFKNMVIPKLQKHVFFTGFVDDETLEQHILESDVIVLQSTDPYYIEASGTLAAVANYGKPIVCSKVPKFQSELQNGKDCILVEPSDSTELVQALLSLMENSELRNCLGNNIIDKFKMRHWDAVAKKHVSLYRNILNKQKLEDGNA